MDTAPGERTDWRVERTTGIRVIAASMVVSAAIWFGIAWYGPVIEGMETLSARMLFALKCMIVATLFCLNGGVEAVAHERLQSAAFDPLLNVETRRLRVNQRYLQNTLEQIVIFAAGLFGLAAYASDGREMRAVLATAIVWIVSRFAFWIGYHRSAAMRGLGAPGMALSLIVLLYVAWRVGYDVGGPVGAWGLIVAYLLLEAILFRSTRSKA